MKYEDLKILDELRSKGSISEEEYQREKEKILNSEQYSVSNQKPLWGIDENTFLLLMHLSQIVSWLIIPLIMWATNKDMNENVNKHGKNILNFSISYAIYFTISAFLIFVLIGIVTTFILSGLYLICIIIATIKAANGEYWKYPFTIDFIK